LSRKVAKAKMMMRARAKASDDDLGIRQGKCIAFSIALNIRNYKRDIAVAVGTLKDCDGGRQNETGQN
jgi:hypothetical protein